MARPIALIGGGGHALSLLDILPSSAKVAGYVDLAPVPSMPLGWLGDDAAFMADCAPDSTDIIVTLVSGADCSLRARRRVIDRYGRYGSPVTVAPSAIVSPSARLGGGPAVFHRATVNAATTAGAHCVINTGAIVEHGCTLGDNVFIGPGAVICGGVTIGDDTYIGAGVIIKPCVSIGAGVTVGAGAVVTADIPAAGTYAGVPARPLHQKR